MIKAPKQREKDIQKGILEFLFYKRIFHYRNNSGAAIGKGDHLIRFGTPGSPDIIAVIRGRYIGIEVKAPGKKLRDTQIAFKDALEAAGGIYWMFDSLDEAVDMITYYTQHE